MIKEALEYIMGLKQPTITEIGSNKYSDKQLTRIDDPTIQPLEVSTLSAIIEQLAARRDNIPLDQVTIHIISPTEVKVISPPLLSGKRHTFIQAAAAVPLLRFGIFYDAETFNITMQAVFAEADDDKNEVIKIAGNLVEEVVKTSIDDGMTQTATIRTGIKVLGRTQIPNPVMLSPYRTFIEVEQPVSRFVFRVQEDCKLALFEADGGAWRNDAMKSIKRYLELALEKTDILIPVLA